MRCRHVEALRPSIGRETASEDKDFPVDCTSGGELARRSHPRAEIPPIEARIIYLERWRGDSVNGAAEDEEARPDGYAGGSGGRN